MAEEFAHSPPIDWNVFLDSSQAEAPIDSLCPTFRHQLAMHLNKETVVTTNDLCPDWSGLAEMIGFDSIEISEIGRHENPGKEVTERWVRNDNLYPSIGNLVKYLVELARMDILNDLGRSLPSTTTSTYDAFVIYESKDASFVNEMTDRLENKGLKLFIPDRDCSIIGNYCAAMSRILSERCRYAIAVLSNNFIQNEVCNFLSTYAFYLNPGARYRKLVVIKVEDCPIPEPMYMLNTCDFTRQAMLDWSWARLEGYLKKAIPYKPMPNRDFIGPESCDLNRLNPSSPSLSPLSSSRSSSLVSCQPSRSSVSQHSITETKGGHSQEDTGYHSGIVN